ncbi:MAG: glycosyltransferase family 39 protein [Bacteroidales bacterium]|nr:glycosyltransferase family 39 protein [Bacteroidales bacterium]
MRSSKWFAVLFFTINLLICSFYIDVWQNGNAVSRALPIITFFESGTFRIDKYHELTPDKAFVNGNYFTDKAPLPTLYVLPFFGLASWTGFISPDEKGNLFGPEVLIIGGILAGSVPLALLITLLYLRIRKYRSGISPVWLSTLPFYGSFMFVFSGTYFGHLFAGALLLIFYLFLQQKRFLLSGIFAGLTFISEYNLAVLIFFMGLFLLWKEKKIKPLLVFALGVLPSILFILWYNSKFSTSPFVFLYKYHNYNQLDQNYGFRLPGIEAFWGLTFSPYRGMFFYVPVLLTGFYFLFRQLINRSIANLLNNILFIPSVLYFIFIASYFAWWGGWCYGPRLLMGMLILLLFEVVTKIAKHPIPKYIVWITIIIGLVINVSAKATIVYDAPTGIYNPFIELVATKFLAGHLNPNNLLSIVFDVPSQLAFVIFSVTLFGGIWVLDIFRPERNLTAEIRHK